MSQFPGMQRDLVRFSLEITWSPQHAEVQLSRRAWRKPLSSDQWLLEDIRVSRPMTWSDAEDAAQQWCADAISELMRIEEGTDPFP